MVGRRGVFLFIFILQSSLSCGYPLFYFNESHYFLIMNEWMNEWMKHLFSLVRNYCKWEHYFEWQQ